MGGSCSPPPHRTWTGTPPSEASGCAGRRRVPPSALKQQCQSESSPVCPPTHHSDSPGCPGSEDRRQQGHSQVGVDEGRPHHHAPQHLQDTSDDVTAQSVVSSHLGQLVVSQGQRPQSEVAGRVRDGAQDVLDGVNTCTCQWQAGRHTSCLPCMIKMSPKPSSSSPLLSTCPS